MKNNLEAVSDKKQRSDNAGYTKPIPCRLLVGVLSTTLLLFSLIGVFAVVSSTRTIAARATLATNSVTMHAAVPADTSTPTTTASPSIKPSPTTTTTATPTPTSTSTPSPTPTAATTPTPTATSKPSPTPTKTAPAPSPTSSSSPTPSLSPTQSSPTAAITATALQSSDQSQTPTSSSAASNTTQAASQDQQNADFPFITLAIGVPATTTAIAFFFIGWWLLRKRLLPVKTAKLPPSGAKPWSRVRTSNTQWSMSSNGSTQPVGSNNQLFNGLAPWGQNNAAPTGISFNNIAPPNNTFVPTALPDYPEGTPDLSSPYLQQVIKQYSDKSRAARQQNLSNIDDMQASRSQNDDTWLQ